MAIAMEMLDPYINTVQESCPEAKVVFDHFHVVAAFNRTIEKVRNAEYRKATESEKEVIKGSKYLLLKNKDNLSDDERPRLVAFLSLNKALVTTYILKDHLKQLYMYKCSRWAAKAIANWFSIAFESGIKPLIEFAKTLISYAYGIINHCEFPIHTGRMEGINNKNKLIKRRAYGFHDIEYFSLIIKDAFAYPN